MASMESSKCAVASAPDDGSKPKKTRQQITKMNKGLSVSWALSSDEESHTEQSDNRIKKACKNKSLGFIFAQCHPNLLSVVLILMQEYGMRLAVATPFLDPAEKYIHTGEYEYAKHEMKLVSPLMITAVGSIEKVLVAALQILFANGARNGSGEDYNVYYHDDGNTCDITINFQFNKHECNVKLQQSDDDKIISIYVED